MQFCTHLPAYLYFRTETKAVLVPKFTTLTSHPYTYITTGSDTLQCISSSPILPVCHLSLSYFSHISLHLSSHQSPPSLTILPLCNDSQYNFFFYANLSSSHIHSLLIQLLLALFTFLLSPSLHPFAYLNPPPSPSFPLSLYPSPLHHLLTFHLHPFSCVAV